MVCHKHNEKHIANPHTHTGPEEPTGQVWEAYTTRESNRKIPQREAKAMPLAIDSANALSPA